MRSKSILVFVGVLLAFNTGAHATVVIDLVTVDNPGNAADDTGYGGVSAVYRISKYEVTAGQYTEFLNAVAATDTYGLYNTKMGDISSSSKGCNIKRSGSSGSYTYSVAADWANRPVNQVSWYDTLRFANWLHNGQPTGGQSAATTEDGAYDMSLGLSVVRKAGATVWLPSEDEWYKAAFHKNDGITNNYFDYPTSSDSVPSNDLINPDPGNNANFWQDGYDWESGYSIGSPYYRTEVGEFENSESPYGTFDQCGNVWEWTEAEGHTWGSSHRVIRGSSWACNVIYTPERELWDYPPTTEYSNIGFRVAQVSAPLIEVAVDIKPASCPNPLNVKSKGMLAVAILGSQDFDVNTVDILSVRLDGVAPVRGSYEDVGTVLADANECECTTEGPDGYPDLTVKFKTGEIVEALGEVIDGEEWILQLTGVLHDDTSIEGEDCIVIRSKSKNGK